MERKTDIEFKVNEALNSVKKVQRAEAPPFFTDKTMQRLHTVNPNSAFSYSGLLKVAAIVVLLMVNVYTIKYILNTNQESTVNTNATSVKDVVNEYQPTDATELTFENKLANE